MAKSHNHILRIKQLLKLETNTVISAKMQCRDSPQIMQFQVTQKNTLKIKKYKIITFSNSHQILPCKNESAMRQR
jgi:hypothetical protein